MQPTGLPAWNKLKQHVKTINKLNLKELERSLSSGSSKYHIEVEDVSLDFNYQRLDDFALDLLLELARESNLESKIKALFTGYHVNTTEDRPALHTALRTFSDEPILVDNKDIIPEIFSTRERMYAISDKIRKGEWLGYSGKPIKDIVNIGIGGSQLGPQFCIKALTDYIIPTLNFHFISDFDPKGFSRALAKLNPETTLFIISSKSLTTMETLHNTKKAWKWVGHKKDINKHFIVVTANTDKAHKYGVTNVLPIWDWVGGRYSFCSAINLITCIAIGSEQFEALLLGANLMDQHVHSAPLAVNISVLLALIGIWNINFLEINNLLMLTYAHDLQNLVPYLQQLDMESNGKSVDNNGQPVQYATGPIVWGGLGNQAQHSYYQLLCQGTHKIAADFISVEGNIDKEINKICAMQKRVLAQGIDEENPYGYIHGRTPINHITMKEFTPKSLGALISMYEHKIYCQSVLWNINPFDQPGVESYKRLLKNNSKI